MYKNNKAIIYGQKSKISFWKGLSPERRKLLAMANALLRSHKKKRQNRKKKQHLDK